MRIEEISKENLEKAQKKELHSLRLRFRQLWDKHFEGTEDVVVGSLNKHDFLEQYSLLAKEAGTRGIKLPTVTIDRALFRKAMKKRKVKIEKPYSNEHSARLRSPDMSYIRVRRTKGGKLYGKKVPTTIGIIWYITRKDGKEVPIAQSLRFPISDWTVKAAKKWLKDNEIKVLTFESAKKVEKELVIIPISKEDEDEHLVSGIVYEPDVADLQGDVMNEEEIQKACYLFMEKSQTFKVSHKGSKISAKVLENYLAPQDIVIEGRPITKGTWLLTLRILDKDVWEKIKDGDLQGYSMAGTGTGTYLE